MEHNHFDGDCGDSCDCGCDHDHAQETIIITLDDGSELECSVLGVFDVENKSYIALMPIGDDEVLIYVYKENGDEVELELIESDDEFDKVSKEFEQLFQFDEFDGFDDVEYIYDEEDDEDYDEDDFDEDEEE